MFRRITSSPRLALSGLLFLLGVVIVAVAATACGGGSGSPLVRPNGGSGQWDVSNARRQAHSALISNSDMPGSGWQYRDDVPTDVPNFLEMPLPKIVACDALVPLQKEIEANAKGQANRMIRQRSDTEATVPATVTAEIQVFESADYVSALLTKERAALQDGTLQQCLERYVHEDLDSAFSTVAVDFNAPMLGRAPEGAIAYGYDATFVEYESVQPIHAEFYFWQKGNAVLQIEVEGDKDRVTADIVNAALQKSESRAAQAVDGG